MPIFTIDTLRTALGEAAFMLLADHDGDRIIGIEDAAAVEQAILAGQGDIDSRIKGKFQTPIDNPPPELRQAYLDAIAYRLCRVGWPIPDDICKRYENSIKWARDVKGDEAQLSSEAQPLLRRASAVTRTGPDRKFTAHKLRDLL